MQSNIRQPGRSEAYLAYPMCNVSQATKSHAVDNLQASCAIYHRYNEITSADFDDTPDQNKRIVHAKGAQSSVHAESKSR